MHCPRILTRFLPLAFAALAAIVFLPALGHDFVAWDDDLNLTANPNYRGFGLEQLAWMMTERRMTHWFPLTWLSFAADHGLWGMKPFGYHLTNVLLHAANTALVYLLALRLLARAAAFDAAGLRVAASGAALLFALHPLRAEPVAWATARSDVLAGLFALLTLLAHGSAIEAHGRRRLVWRGLSVAAFALALASKSAVMTLPLVLVVLDVYPLRRLPAAPSQWAAARLRPLWREKLPYFALGAAGATVAYSTAVHNGVLTDPAQYPLTARLAMAAYSLTFFLVKTVLPMALMPLYELPARVNPLEPRFLASIIAVVAITGVAVGMRRRWPAGLALWAAYVLMLAPVSGLVHAGHHLAYDRYSYLPALGWALLAGAGIAALRRGLAGARPAFGHAAVAAAVVAVVGLATLTVQQVAVWRDTGTLWRYAVVTDPACSICRSNLGVTLYGAGQAEAAREQFEAALALRPDRARARLNLGVALVALGDLPRAEGELTRVVASYPGSVNALNALGVTLIKQGRPEAALPHLERAVALAGDDPYARTHLAIALSATGRADQAIAHYRRAIELLPAAGEPRLGLARAHLVLGDIEAAREQYETLKRLDSRMAAALDERLAGRQGGRNR